MKNKVIKSLLFSVGTLALVGTSALAMDMNNANISYCMTQDEYIALFDGCTSKEDYYRRAHAAGIGTDEDLADALNKIGASSSTSQSTPSTPTTPATPKCEHTYEEAVTVEPTCKDKGEKVFTCSKCGDEYKEDIAVNENAHRYVESITVEPTCESEGTKTFTCEVCGDTYTEPLAKTEHEYIATITTEPTCVDAGIKTYVCTICEDTYTENVSALGHTEGETVVTKPNGLFTEGTAEIRCSRCGEVLRTEVIPSAYPIWYLAVVGALLVAIIGGVVLIARKKK